MENKGSVRDNSSWNRIKKLYKLKKEKNKKKNKKEREKFKYLSCWFSVGINSRRQNLESWNILLNMNHGN